MCCSEKDDTLGVKANGIMIKVKGMNKAGVGEIGDSYHTGESSDEDTQEKMHFLQETINTLQQSYSPNVDHPSQ